MHIVESEIEEKGTLPHRRHPFQGGICQGIRCVSACGIAVGVLLETELFGFHEDIKALPGGSSGTAAATAKIPHAEKSGGVTGWFQGLGQRDRLGGERFATWGGKDFVVRGPW